jgi:hypothetical protein
MTRPNQAWAIQKFAGGQDGSTFPREGTVNTLVTLQRRLLISRTSACFNKRPIPLILRYLICTISSILVGVTWSAAQTTSEAQSADAGVKEVTDEGLKKEIFRRFETSLGELGSPAHIDKCAFVLEYRDSRNVRDFSVGALCRVDVGSAKRVLLMCDDWMIGRFTLKRDWSMEVPSPGAYILDNPSLMSPTAYVNLRESIGSFIKYECPPGA